MGTHQTLHPLGLYQMAPGCSDSPSPLQVCSLLRDGSARPRCAEPGGLLIPP